MATLELPREMRRISDPPSRDRAGCSCVRTESLSANDVEEHSFMQQWLTPLAAAGLVAIMTLAMAFHVSRGEPFALPINGTLCTLAAFVA
jgi:hypothetical protein